MAKRNLTSSRLVALRVSLADKLINLQYQSSLLVTLCFVTFSTFTTGRSISLSKKILSIVIVWGIYFARHHS